MSCRTAAASARFSRSRGTPASTSIAGLGAFRVVERLGKGFRGLPRDAWLSSIAEPETRGLSFGVHKALDKAGAVVGPLVAYGLLS